MLCHFIFLIERKYIRFLFIISICFITFINHILYENTFKFYSKPFYTKPQVKQSLEIINSSKTNSLTIKFSENNVNHINDVYENYILKYIEKKKFQINYFNSQDEKIKPDRTWVLYFKDITKEKFKIPNIFNNYKIVKKVNLNRLDLILIERNKK